MVQKKFQTLEVKIFRSSEFGTTWFCYVSAFSERQMLFGSDNKYFSRAQTLKM